MCGLKQNSVRIPPLHIVTPHVGVWIETYSHACFMSSSFVTPHVGVWIETNQSLYVPPLTAVTPHVGVWIETPKNIRKRLQEGHTSCRCVD